MSDEERDAIEREMEQCAAEEAARAEAEAEADRAMSDEGKVICEKAKSGECLGFHGVHCKPHIEFMVCTKSKVWCSWLDDKVKCVPCKGEEERK